MKNDEDKTFIEEASDVLKKIDHRTFMEKINDLLIEQLHETRRP